MTLKKRPIPRKLNPGMIIALSEYIRKGNYAVTACHLVGITEQALWDWHKLAEQDLADGLTAEESIYINLVESLKRAEADAEDLMVQTARNAAIEKKDGYLAITVNERRHPDRWGRRERHDVNVTETKTIQITSINIISPSTQGEIVEGEVRELEEGKE